MTHFKFSKECPSAIPKAVRVYTCDTDRIEHRVDQRSAKWAMLKKPFQRVTVPVLRAIGVKQKFRLPDNTVSWHCVWFTQRECPLLLNPVVRLIEYFALGPSSSADARTVTSWA